MKTQNIIPRVAKHAHAFTVATLMTCIAALMVTYSLRAGDRPAPGQSHAFGASLAEWQEVYWQWAYGQVDLPVDNNGNAVVGHVVLMPLPDNGSLDVTLNAGQAFMLPLWNILGTSWDDGTPTDPALDLSVFKTLDITLKIDGVTVINSRNVMKYYAAFDFDPEIPLPADWSPYQAIVWFQGIGMVHQPLSAGHGGHHTITLDAKNTVPVVDGKGDAYVFEYHNTWNVTVNSNGHQNGNQNAHCR